MWNDKVIVLLLVFTIIAVNTFADQSFGLCEKGDLVFREMPHVVGHVGIYCNWSDGDPFDEYNQRIVESPGEGKVVHDTTFLYFFTQGGFWGARRYPLDPPAPPYYYQRKAIVKFVREKIGCDYHFIEYKGPNRWRCDGLAEAAYESVGLDIIKFDTFLTLSPSKQFQTMIPAEGLPSDITSTYPDIGNIVSGGVTLRAVLDDELFGSGPRKVIFYIDDVFIGEEDENGDVVKQYTCPWNSGDVDDGWHTLRVRGYDQSGNIGEKEVEFYVNNFYPVVSFTNPSDGAVDVDVYSDIVISFNREMDQSTVNSGTVLFSPPLHGGFTTEWSGGKTVTLTLTNPEEDLEFYTNYTVTVTDGVKDTSGVKLDGDRDDEGMFLRNGDWLLCNGKSSSLHSERRLALRYARSGFGCSATVGCSKGSKRNYLITNYEIL
jgi:hypothetical protein